MAPPIHILHVVRTLIVEGGMERAMRRVIGGLNERGIRSTVLLLSDAEDILDLDGVAPLERIHYGAKDPRMPLAIRALLSRLAPTAIHVRNWGPWLDTTLARVFLRPRTPLVWSFHGVESLEQLSPRRQLLLRTAAMFTSRIFAVSEGARRLLSDMIGIPESRIEVIMNGVDERRFHPAPALPPGRLILGTCGRLEPIKNQSLLIEAVGDAVRFGADVELRVAGRGSLEPRLRALACAHGIEERVQFLGHVDDVPSFLRSLSAFALTSDNEGNPNALLEAMATGLPVVATAAGGVVELVRPGDDGLLVPVQDRGRLAEAIQRLARDRAYAARLGAAARARVLERFALVHMLDAYEALYTDPAGDPMRQRVSRRLAQADRLAKAG